MSWQNDSETMLRIILNDAGCGEREFSDERLQDLLITAAYLLPIELNFSTSYSVDIDARTVSPSPDDSTDGKDFIAFMVLKAACLADQGKFRTAALAQGVTARCGPAMIQTTNYGQYLATLLDRGPCASFAELTNEYNFSYEGSRIIRAVMTPFAANDYNPINHNINSSSDLQNEQRMR